MSVLCSLYTPVAALFWALSVLSCIFAAVSPHLQSATSYGGLRGKAAGRGKPAFPLLASLPTVPTQVAFGSFYATLLTLTAAGITLHIMYLPSAEGNSSPSYHSMLLAPLALACHGARRLYEVMCVHVFSSTSHVPVVTWVAGLAFYVFVSLAWAHNPILCATPISHVPLIEPVPLSSSSHTSVAQSVAGDLSHTSGLQALACLVFLICNIVQHRCHVALADLRRQTIVRTYSYPSTNLFFRACTCPHYSAECCLYGSALFLVCPEARWAILSALLFTCANLTVTATHSLKAYQERSMQVPPYCILPGVW